MNLALELIILALCKIALANHQMEEEELLRIKRYGDEELKNCDQCGLSFDRAQRVPVIINGTNVVSSEKYPWMVALLFTGSTETFCGGAIIARDFVLTAAHCVEKRNEPMKRDKKNGAGKGCSEDDGKGFFMSSQEVTVGFMTPGWYTGVRPLTTASKVIIHPEYKTGGAHDIALIQLANPINCNYHANPICLPPPNVVLPPHSLVRISGYGQEYPTNPEPSKELNEATIEVRDTKECKIMGFDMEDLKKMYCLKGYKGQTPCFGDSGGSMFAKIYGGKYVTLGVASLHSSKLCDTESVVVYTSVPYHLPWIHQMMEGGESGNYDYGHDSQDDFWYYYGYDDHGGMKGKEQDQKGKKTKITSTKKGRPNKGKDDR